MQTSSPSFSIGVAVVAKNCGPFIEECLESVRRQVPQAAAMAVIDNGSSDGTWEIVQTWVREKRIPELRVARCEKGNLAELRNAANSLLGTDYIAVLDGDDMLAEGALAAYSRCLQEKRSADFVLGDCDYWLTNKRRRWSYPTYNDPVRLRRAVLGRGIVPFKHSAMLYRREFVEAIGGYSSEFPRKIDIYLVLQALSHGARFVKIKDCVAVHRKHELQVTARRMAGMKYWYALIDLFEPSPIHRALCKLKRFASEAFKSCVGM